MAEPGRRLFRVGCQVCGWRGYRRTPQGRRCPNLTCGADPEKIETLWVAGQGPGIWRTYLICLAWPAGWRRDPADHRYLITPTGERIRFHAQHYTGKTKDLPTRLADHLAGRGAGVLAAAMALGATPRLARTWIEPSREWRFKRRRRRLPSPQSRCTVRRGVIEGMTRYCPFCKEERMQLTKPRRAGLEVLAATYPSAARRSNRTDKRKGHIYWQVADWMHEAGLAELDGYENLRITEAGRQLCADLDITLRDGDVSRETSPEEVAADA